MCILGCLRPQGFPTIPTLSSHPKSRTSHRQRFKPLSPIASYYFVRALRTPAYSPCDRERDFDDMGYPQLIPSSPFNSQTSSISLACHNDSAQTKPLLRSLNGDVVILPWRYQVPPSVVVTLRPKTSGATNTAGFLTKSLRRTKILSTVLAFAMKIWFSAGVTRVKAEP
jgi:hypothetical protein